MFKLAKNGGAVFTDYGVAAPLVGMIVAGISAFIAVRTFVAILKSRNLAGFGWYHLAIAVLAIVFLATNQSQTKPTVAANTSIRGRQFGHHGDDERIRAARGEPCPEGDRTSVKVRPTTRRATKSVSVS